MEIDRSLLDEISFPSVVSAELRSHQKLLPPNWADRALRGSGSELHVSEWVTSACRHSLKVEPEEIVLARKLGRGARPIALLGLKERLIYRGLGSLVEAGVGAPDRSPEAFETFQVAPLAVKDATHVFKADIASYYQYVDHERLVDEVVAQIGDDRAISAIARLLQASSGRRFAIPQLNATSDVLAEVYIDPMRRDLVRAGFDVWRFADDFRIACRGYAEALRALEVADRSARELGLVLNELKTSTPGVGTYLASLSSTEDREQELFDSLDIDEFVDLEPGEYTDLDDEFDTEDGPASLVPDEDPHQVTEDAPESAQEVSPAQLEAARKVLALWVSEEEDEDTQRSERAHVTARLLGRALRTLGVAEDPSALANTVAILVYEPSLTPTLARYMGDCAGSDRSSVAEALDEVFESRSISAWQAIWMAHVAGELPRPSRGVRKAHAEWLVASLSSSQPSLRAGAAIALGRRRLASSSVLLDAMTHLPPLHRRTALMAVAAVDEGSATNVAESELDRVAARWAAERL